MSKKIKKSDLRPDYTQHCNCLYSERWHGTQQEFADAVLQYMPEDKNVSFDKKYVSKWLNGDLPLLKYLPAICKVLQTEISEFTISSHADQYRYLPSYVNGLEQQLSEKAEKDFSIDLTFFQGIRNIIPDFDSKFPIYSPLLFYEDDAIRKPYERSMSAETLAPAGKAGLFRVMRNGEYVFLTKYDMKLIKCLQDYLKKCAYRWFEIVSTDLIAAEAEANLKFEENNPSIFELNELSDEELQKLDPWGIYTEKEKKKYNLQDDETGNETSGGNDQ